MTNDQFTNFTIAAYGGKKPVVDPSVFICDGARIIGDVKIAKDASVWFNAVLRGDINYISIGERTNIQDNCAVHVTQDTHPVVIGNDVTVGHNVILHGCRVHHHALIGMGAVLLDGAEVNSFALVAAGSVVLQNTIVPEGVLVAGTPAKVIRPLKGFEKQQIEQAAKNYCNYVRRYRAKMF